MIENAEELEEIKRVVGVGKLTERELSCIEEWHDKYKADRPLIKYAVMAAADINKGRETGKISRPSIIGWG